MDQTVTKEKEESKDKKKAKEESKEGKKEEKGYGKKGTTCVTSPKSELYWPSAHYSSCEITTLGQFLHM